MWIRHVAVRGSWVSVARHPAYGEKGTADRTAVPCRADRLCDRHRSRAGRALAGGAALHSPQPLLSLASLGSRERPVPHQRPHDEQRSQRRRLTKTGSMDGEKFQFHINNEEKQCKNANLEIVT
ncbi:hypothetical protein LC608_05480 [Nostoc sp. XA010]|uniref:hypothetical protein n=1 Tax=Nostoc sp. XA010 TaxID=2780407 RepID=UPI001E4B6517|nr:hypothetical protein [Nostoc sp. XA010]MCC5656440.1 hypothetical protein [Nostoc sp. XA010]